MSKHYLTTLLTAAFVAIGGGYAQAQTDVTSTYIPNAGFEECTAATANIASKTGTDYSDNGWTFNSAKIDNSCSGVVSYGNSVTVNNVKAPTTDNAGNTGNALGISVGWSQTITYSTAKVTLPAGSYKFTAHIYNNNTSPHSGSDGTTFNSQLAFVPTSGTAIMSTTTSATVGEWAEDAITFTLSEATEGTFQIGSKANNTYSTSHAIIFIDNLTLQEYDKAEDLPGYVFADGTYYLYDETNNMFLSRGANWGTRAIADKYGVPLTATLNNGKYTLKEANFNSSTQYIYVSGESVWTDNTTNDAFTVTSSGNGYVFAQDDKYMTVADGLINMTSTESDATVWTLKTENERNAIIANYPSENITSVIGKANLSSEVTADNFVSTLNNDYISISKDDIAPTAYTYNKVDGEDATLVTPRQVYQGCGTFTYTVSGLDEGIYKVIVPALFRNGSPEFCVSLKDQYTNNSTAYIIANDEQVRIKGWAEEYTETNNPNSVSEAGTAFDAGRYSNEVYCYVGSDGKLTLTVAFPSYVKDVKQWAIFGNTKLTYYGEKSKYATETSDYEALNAAIKAAEEKTLGFEKDEYAPYNNVTAIKALAAAKDIDQTANNLKTDVEAATTALTSATWTANADEINAIYDGDFSEAEISENAGDANAELQKYGWSANTNLRLVFDNTRKDGNNKAKLSEGQKAIYSQPNNAAVYGKQNGYTMPLKANTIYEVSVDYAGWQAAQSITVSVLNSDNKTIKSTSFAKAKNIFASDGALSTAKMQFATSDAGNYVLQIQGSGNYVFTNVSLMKATVALDETATEAPIAGAAKAVTLNRTFAEGWNSVVLPFATTAEALGADEAAEYKGTEENKLKFSTVTDLKANTPYLVHFTAAQTEAKTFEGVTINPATAPTASDANNQYDFVGTYTALAKGNTTIAEGDYITVKAGIQKAAGGNALKAFRAYFKNNNPTATSEAKNMVLVIDDNTISTGINAVNAESADDDNVYNVAGQKVSNSYKGLVIKNGKKYLRK